MRKQDPTARVAVCRRGGRGAGQLRVFYFLHPLVTHLRQPAFERFRFGRRDGLNDTEQGFRIGAIGIPLFSVGRGKFQPYDFFVRLLRARLLSQLPLEVRPVTLGDGRFGKNAHHVDDRKPPLLVMPSAADRLFLKNHKMVFRFVGYCGFFAHGIFLPDSGFILVPR